MDLFDKPRKPYVPIDTSSPGGTWIEEKRYNRSRPTGVGSRKVLCGNWQEEQVLEDDMLRIEATADTARTTTTAASSTAAAGCMTLGSEASLDVIKVTANGQYTGGFKSTPYLTCEAADPTARHLDTTHRVDYTTTSGDVTQLRRPDLGVRSQVLLQQALAAAKAAQDDCTEQTARLRASAAGSSQKRVGGNAELGTINDAYVSVYKASMCDGEEVLPVVDELQDDYISDEPITLYTGNPQTGETMTVHGKTPVDPSGTSRFGRHTNFSERKYAL